MKKELYKSDEMSINGEMANITIGKTDKGISVKRRSLYDDGQEAISYYKDYPMIPGEWDAIITEDGVSEAQIFLDRLDEYKPFRVSTVKK